ncbi:MAG: ATP-binding protein [Moraxellaceae bacterium]|nr:ATP-binding protein [Moraxellaceae bacterium]
MTSQYNQTQFMQSQRINQRINQRIKKLPPLLINQLSAGEVVTRPASVVKELLENAIDAGANKITINITQGGMGLIEIIDNGSGIHPDDMLMAVTRHATSKVADVEHLHGIDTLGFRGEALASISAVSRLTLTSSHDNSGVGRCLSIAGEIDNPSINPVVCQQGTQVAVRDLYFNVPARRGNLKSIATEYAHIEAVVSHVALVYSDISLKLYHDGKCRLQLLAKNESKNEAQETNQHLSPTQQNINPHLPPISRLQQALSIMSTSSMAMSNEPYELSVDLSALQSIDNQTHTSEVSELSQSDHAQINQNSPTTKPSIDGWIWLADDNNDSINNQLNTSLANGKTSKQTSKANSSLPRLIYINDRLVTDNSIRQQLRQSMQTLDISMDSVGYALFFYLPSSWLNLNIHPTKQRISIHALANINAHLHHGIQELLRPVMSQRLQRVQNQQPTPATDSDNNYNEHHSHNEKVETDNQDHLYLSKQSSQHYQAYANRQVASPSAVYQIDNDKVINEKIADTGGSQYQQPLHTCQLQLQLQLKLNPTQTEQTLNTIMDKLANVLETDNIDSISSIDNVDNNIDSQLDNNKDKLQKDKDSIDAYRIVINLTINSTDSTKTMIKMADRICRPWTIDYQRKTDTVTLLFNKNKESCFQQSQFEGIEWGRVIVL